MQAILSSKPKAYSYIRFSTPEQIHGDSLRRQTEAAEKYAKENGLLLDEQLKLNDLGLSAFHGKHRKEGALGVFLKLIEEGKIDKGSVLIVENLDRLSREQPMNALRYFISIINAGITLVTLADKQKYTFDSLNENVSQLYLSIGEMVRANKESARKSELLSAAWEQKRRLVTDGKAKLTARCPAWLRLSEDKTKFIKNQRACEAIKFIYESRLSGNGATRIERIMNQSNLWKPAKKGNNKIGGWRKSYILKILQSKAVIGIYQPHKLVNNKRQPVGMPIPDYFPKIISDKMFYQVQRIMENNKNLFKGNGGGKTGKANNLFTHIVSCGVCGAPMHFVNKGDGAKGGTYLHCYSASRKLMENEKPVCTAKPIKYEEFEKLVFHNLEELNLSDILPNSNEIQLQQKAISEQEAANKQQLNTLVFGIENLIDSIASTKDKRVREALNIRLQRMFDDKEKLIQNINDLNMKSIELQQTIKQFYETIDATTDIYKLLSKTKNEQERIRLRLRLRLEIRKIVKQIQVYPLQEKYQHITDMKDVEPGLYKIMNSKYIDHVRIKFHGNKNVRVLYLTGMAIPEFY